MSKKLIVSGCSFTKDNYQKVWPDYLSKELDCELINLAARGAGINFISKRLLTYLSENKHEDMLVMILLPSSDRFDIYVDNLHPLISNFLNIASWQNGKNSNLINLDGSLSNEHGYSLTGGEHRGIKKYWYKYFYNETFSFINYWFDVLTIQNFLQLNKIEYFLIPAYNLNDLVEQSKNKSKVIDRSVLNLIDFDKFIFYKDKCGFLEFVRDHKFPSVKHYPVSAAHEAFVKDIVLPAYDKK